MAFDSMPLSEEEWAKAREASVRAMPELFEGKGLPDILMPSQKKLLMATATNQLVVTEKSRRIGFTWAVGADAVLTAGAEKPAGGMDVLYIGYNLDMAREFIDTCAMWAKAFMPACTEVAEFLFPDKDESGADKAIQAFRIRFASGFEITALSSRPRSLRGRQGYVILDEFAFHDDATGLLKAAMALLIWGGKVLVISTHNGADNPFNELITEIREGRRPGEVVRCTFDQALEEGLYQRVCLMTGKTWSPEGEARWRTDIRKFYGADAAEELDCVPSQGSGVYLTRTLIEACAVLAGPILRLHCPAGFDLRPKPERISYVDAWLEQNVEPVVLGLEKNLRHAFGQDFARSGDVSCYVPITVQRDLSRTVPFVIEMRNVPYEQQKQINHWVSERLPRFSAGKIDSNGNGNYLGEVSQQKFGAERIEKVMPTQGWYLENMPRMKAALEDRTLAFPKDADLVDDLRQIKLAKGVPIVPHDARHKGSDGLFRHGDFAVALCLAFAASREDGVEYDYRPVARHTALDRGQVSDDDDFSRRHGGAFARADEGRASLRRQGAW